MKTLPVYRGFLILTLLGAGIPTAPARAQDSDAQESGTIRSRIRERIRQRMRERTTERTAAENSTDSQEQEAQSLEYGGRSRSYLLHLPAGYSKHNSLPLVLVLHGGGGTMEGAVRMSDMNAKADKEGFIAAYPGGTGLGKHLTWNSWNCCGYAMKRRIDDTGFIGALIDKLEAENNVDPSRVYVTGLSNGAMMAYKLACDLSDRIAAAAPVAGAVNGECKPTRPVPMIIFHGTADQHLPYNGGYGAKSFVKHEDHSVAYAVSLWAKNNGCAPKPEKSERGNIIQDNYKNCTAGADVVLYTIKGQGHAWPGGKEGAHNGNVDPPTREISATDLIWLFFAAHPKPKALSR